MKCLASISVIVLLSFYTAFSQSEGIAPSLQVGLSGIKFNKGLLDEELIASLIAKKQNEVKVKVVKDMLLGALGNCGETYYAFADNSINTILLERDETVRMKNLMENTVNFAFVQGFALYSSRVVNQKDGYLKQELYNCLDALEKYELAKGNKEISEGVRSYINYLRYGNEGRYVNQKEKGHIQQEVVNRKKGEMLAHGLVLDLCFDIVRNSPNLKQLGLYRTNYTNDYQSFNLYSQYRDEISGTDNKVPSTMVATILDTSIIIAVKMKEKATLQNEISSSRVILAEKLKTLRDNLDEELNGLIDMAGFYNVMDMNQSKLHCDTNVAKMNKGIKDLIDAVDVGLLSAHGSIPLDDKEKENALRTLLEYQVKLKGVMAKETKQELSNSGDLAQAFYLLNKNLIPAYGKLILDKKELQISYVQALDVTSMLECYLSQKSDYKELKESHRLFFSLIGGVYGFDDARTYVDYLNALSDVGNLLPDNEARNSINKITSFIRRYVKVVSDEKETYLDIDVQGFLLSLKEIKPKRFRPVQFLFSVGANSAIFASPDFAGYMTDDGTGYAKNFTFMGERIGLKLKVFDFAYTRSFNKGETFKYWGITYKRLAPPKKPTVSDLFLNFYGSGILYNLTKVTTVKNFTDPIVGLGIGATFFNGLEMSVGAGVPISPSKDFNATMNSTYFDLNFSIRFEEYLEALNEKVKNNKTTKTLQKASMNQKAKAEQSTGK